MAVGKPLLMAIDGYSSDLVRSSNFCHVAESESSESLLASVQALLDASPEVLSGMADNGRNFYRENLSLSKGTQSFARIFNKLSKQR